jgi:hypothetical protein
VADDREIERQDGLPVSTGRDVTPEGFVILATGPARCHPVAALWYDRFPRETSGGPLGDAAVFGTDTRGGEVRRSQQFMYFQFLGFPSASHSIVVASRFERVASVLASVIHSTYSRLLVKLNRSKVDRAAC